MTAVASRATGQSLCARCYNHPVRPCGQCGRTRRVAVTARAGEPDLCPTCHQAPKLTCGRCGEFGECRTTTADRTPICWRCQLHRELDRALGPAVPAPLAPLLTPLRTAENPRSVLGWLARSPAVPVLTALAAWQAPLHHQTLDEAGVEHGGRSYAIEHLRQLLVASAALPDRDEHLHRLEQRLAHVITEAHPDDHPVLRAYATWHLLRRLRSRADQDAPTLHAANRCSQADLDAWLTSRSTARRLLPTFLTWAAQERHLPAALHIPAAPAWQLGAADPADQRWTQARRLLHDDTLPAPDRVAGLLILLYGQTSPASAGCAGTTSTSTMKAQRGSACGSELPCGALPRPERRLPPRR